MIVKPGEGRAFCVGDQHVRVKTDTDTPGGAAIVETTLPPGSGAPRHLHHDHDETFYVVSGALEVEIDGTTVVLRSGGLARAVRGTAHAFRNPGPEPAVVLGMYDPAPSLEYLELLGAAVALTDPGARQLAVDDLYTRFETESA